MRILALRPEADRGSGQTRTVARFDVELDADIRLHNPALRRRPDGRFQVFSPNLQGINIASFSPALVARLAAAAAVVYHSQGAHERNEHQQSA